MFNKQNELSAVEKSVLSALQGQELYALEIVDKTNLPKVMPFRTLYPALNRLEKKGLISWRWGENKQEMRGENRLKYYKLTASGEACLITKTE